MKALFCLFEASRRGFIILIVTLIVLVNFMSPQFQTPASAAGTNCISSSPSGGAYTVTPCFTSPADGATVSGDQTVSVTAALAGPNTGISKLIFYLNGQYLITDFQSPYSFVLPTTKWVDGSQTCQRPQVGADLITSDVPSNITLTLDGSDVTAEAVILQTMVTPASLTTIIFIPTNDLGLGVHQAVLTYPSGSGPQIQPWSFTVASISCQGPLPVIIYNIHEAGAFQIVTIKSGKR
jgi:hypothetical protein